jgi:hypothetical protein
MAMRIDTRLETEAAEFLVLGHLLLNRISAFKAYVNFPGYDLIATDAESNRNAKIQVKSRYQSGWNGFLIKNLGSDFVVLVALNRGYTRPRKNGGTGMKNPEFYVLPTPYVQKLRNPKSAWGHVAKARMSDLEQYRDRWDLINAFLKAQP